MRLAVVILTYKRPQLLKRCLESLQSQTGHSFEVRLYILVNGHDSETCEFLKENDIAFEEVSEQMPVGEARNKLIEEIQEPLICFLDDDIFLPEDYFKRAQDHMRSLPDVQMFGGPDQTPPDSSFFQSTLGMVMKSYLANGPTNKRHGHMGGPAEEGDEINLILCNFWAKTEVFKIKKFPDHFRRNEENYLLAVLKDRGVKMRRLPDLFVYHQRKSSLYKLCKTLFMAGVYRSVSMCFYPKSAKAIFFIHQSLLVFLLISLRTFPALGLALIIGYLALIMAESARIAANKNNLGAMPLAMLLFMVFNFTYPIGQFVGYLKAASYFIKGQRF